MEQLRRFDYRKICQPVVVYAVIATIVAFVGMFITMATSSTTLGTAAGHLFGQMSGILICSLILLAICNYISESAAWGVLIAMILLNVLSIGAILYSFLYMGSSTMTLTTPEQY